MIWWVFPYFWVDTHIVVIEFSPRFTTECEVSAVSSKSKSARSVGFMNAGIADPEVRKKKLNAEYLGSMDFSGSCKGW